MPRREPAPFHGAYANAILDEKPLAYWRCEEFEGNQLADASGNEVHGEIKGGVAYHLRGPKNESFSGDSRNVSLQLAGGTVSATIPNARSLSFWFWNGMSTSARDNTGDLVAQGNSFKLRIGGKADGKARGHLVLQVGEKGFEEPPDSASGHGAKSCFPGTIPTSIFFLTAIPKLRFRLQSGQHRASGTWVASYPLEGRIGEVAWFNLR